MISPKEILQIDATILAGLLILLTIISIGIEKDTALADLNEQLQSFAKETEKGVLALTNELNFKEKESSDKKAELLEVQNELDAVLSREQVREIRKNVSQLILNLKIDIGQTEATPEKLALLSTLERDESRLFSMSLQNEEDRKKPFLEKIDLLKNQTALLDSKVNELRLSRDDLIKNSVPKLAEIKEDISSYIKEKGLEEESSQLKKPEDWVYYIGTPFSLSAFFAVLLSIYDKEQIKTGRLPRMLWFLSIGIMGAGFVFLTWIFLRIGNVL